MAMAISYNWLFQWDKKHFINGVWGDFLVLIMGITRAISLVFRYIPISKPSSLTSHVHQLHMECSIIQIFNSKIQLPQGKFPNGTGGRRHFLCLNVARFWPLRENFRYAWTASCSSVERSLDAELL